MAKHSTTSFHRRFPEAGARAIRTAGWGTAALAALLAIAAADSRAGEWRVPSSGTPTVAAALAKAKDGDRVLLAPGTYPERLIVQKRVTLTALRPGADRPVIDGGGEGRVVELRAPGSALEGIHVRKSGDNLERTDACVYIAGTAENARVHDNMLSDCAFGVWVHGAAGTDISGNRISGKPQASFSRRGNGINLWNVSRGLVRANAIEQVRDGIYMAATSDSSVSMNRMRLVRFGIHYMYSDRNRITANAACDSLVGMALMSSRGLTVENNSMLHNRNHGILLRTVYDSRIAGNLAQANHSGLVLSDSAFDRIEGNRVARNAEGVHVTGGHEETVVIGNAFLGNPIQVLYSMIRSASWDEGGRGNYWSDYLGWDLNRDGVGDRPHQATRAMDRLVFRYPELKVLAASPVSLMMQWVESKFPVARSAGVIDRYPAMRDSLAVGALSGQALTEAFLSAASGTAAASGADFCADVPDQPTLPPTFGAAVGRSDEDDG